MNLKMNWKKVKNFGQIKYFNISYIVMIIVPLLANTFETLNEKFGYELLIPITVKSLYFASIIYAVAIAIYQYKCPSLIKDYENIQDYIDRNLKQYENKAPDLKYHIILAHLDKDTQMETMTKVIDLNSKISSTTLTESKRKEFEFEFEKTINLVYSSCVQTHLTKKYNDENSIGKFWIYSSGALYVIGSLIVFLLLIMRTVKVFNN